MENFGNSCYSCYSWLKNMKIETGESVVIILQNPREKIVGILHEISAAGIFARGIDLGYFEEWTRAIAGGEPYLPMQDYFFPMWRVERMSRDESSFEMPSMAEQFRQKTGLDFADF
jgi:hypothetical protein